MPVVPNRPAYRRLFAAQLLSLAGSGLATVALGLLAYRLAGADASAVLGTALGIKMVAYVVVSPLAGRLAARLPRRTLLVGLDLARAALALTLPFVTRVWQVLALVLLLQAASALFTPVYQATLPALLPAEADYTRALTLSRLAYDLESLASPALAAALLTVVPFPWLFAGTGLGFLASAALVVRTALPGGPEPAGADGHGPAGADGHGPDRTDLRPAPGFRLFLATPRLRALAALNLAVAAAGSMVLVNTVLLVRHGLGRSETDVALALAAYGAGSMAVALALPRLLRRVGDRAVMLPGALLLAGLLTLPALVLSLAPDATGVSAGPGAPAASPGPAAWPLLLTAWLLLGAAGSAVLTPTGRVIRRSAAPAALPAAFAAQFALSHACWLLTYPLAGRLATTAGPAGAAAALGALALAGAVTALRSWPRRDPEALEHLHGELPPDHPHLAGAVPTGSGRRHSHAFRIDPLHPRWPARP
ncbi:MFS transporter [Streptomyces sp. NPDC097619]|uniref:MFS transporter n=1 Tax=Streptomyces sp. NPDC097619 TaxID=3157228 RepID=UPI003326776A